jgi:hypothetical protein
MRQRGCAHGRSGHEQLVGDAAVGMARTDAQAAMPEACNNERRTSQQGYARMQRWRAARRSDAGAPVDMWAPRMENLETGSRSQRENSGVFDPHTACRCRLSVEKRFPPLFFSFFINLLAMSSNCLCGSFVNAMKTILVGALGLPLDLGLGGAWQGSGAFLVAITLWSFSFVPPVVSQVIYLELLAAILKNQSSFRLSDELLDFVLEAAPLSFLVSLVWVRIGRMIAGLGFIDRWLWPGSLSLNVLLEGGSFAPPSDCIHIHTRFQSVLNRRQEDSTGCCFRSLSRCTVRHLSPTRCLHTMEA